MFGGIACPLAVLVIAWVLCPDPVKSQCTSKYCRDSEDEPGLRTMVLRVLDSMEMLQQQMTKQEELIRSMKEEAFGMCMYYAVVYNIIDDDREAE